VENRYGGILKQALEHQVEKRAMDLVEL